MQDVVVGYLNGAFITQEFHHCLFGLFIHDAWGPQRIKNFSPQFSNVNVCRARNDMVNAMLGQDAEWLLMFDADAAFPADILTSLLAVADPTERPIVGALAHQKRGKMDADGPVLDRLGNQIAEIIPTMYQLAYEDGSYTGYREVERYALGLNEVDATGCHCLLVHRSVFEAIKSEHPYRWFREDEWGPGGPIVGEDIWFCLKAREVGYPIYVDTRIEVGHVKQFTMTSMMSEVERIV